MPDVAIALLGLGSEYALAGFAAQARRRGLEVVELDMYDADWRERAAALRTRPFVLVTSHHPYLDAASHDTYFGVAADVLSLPEFIHQYRPSRSYFVPHDLSEQFHDEELHCLHLFDALLMPDERYWFLRQYVPVECVGWAKMAARADLPAVELTFMPSEVAHYARNPASVFAEAFGPVLALHPRVKFARFDGTGPLEELVGRMGCEVIPATVDSTSLLLRTNLLVSSGVSSVIAEAAALGVPALCIDDGVVAPGMQASTFAGVDGVSILSAEACASWVAAQRAARPGRTGAAERPAFDDDRALSIILQR